ncbi:MULTISPECIES: flagellar filament capping protein FliD [unclassified Clostridium]|uniref:flagellar filament capping protein FliD n=1 Tax=unclassified Clostridium TaxID=2614128 RepID=UPI000297F126|nr:MULTISPECIES: flagellar filament capping protein FliD [unclassified Clostridium]EKQ51138.1 MAG: flagellar capping protein [Clostridium sp. Maddingley MBC34-26]
MTTRITGLSGSGLDIDSLVTETLKPYKMKVQTEQQQEQLLEWKTEQYQAIMKKANTFYNKYLDPLSSTSLYSMSAYNQSKFTSSNDAYVSAVGSSNASIQNYTVSVTQIATKATGKISNSDLSSMAAAEVAAGTSYTASTTIADQTISFSAQVGTANQSTNLTNFKNSIQTTINNLQTAYSTETDSSKKATIDANIKTLWSTIGQDYTRASNGTWSTSATAGYTDTNLTNTMNSLSVATNTAITASDGTNNITSKLYVKLDGTVDTNATISNYNKQTGASNITLKYSSVSAGLVFEARDAGDKTLTINGTSQAPTKGYDLNATVKDSYGGSMTVTGSSNTKTIDGVTFTFKANTTSDITVTGSQDVSGLKDKIVNFMNDYNDLLGTINGKLWEEYDKDYQPLTDDQKSAMSTDQIDKWETKAKTGLLRNDDDLTTLSDNMKDVMNTIMKSTGLDLERIGITPVDDYKELNGTYTVDQDKLTEALQSNFADIKDLFMKGYGDDTTTDSGLMPKLKSLINDNFIKFDSVFNKKSAYSGVYAYTSEMAKQISDKKQLISDMNDDLNTRQDDLYSKYSKLESAMSEAEAQQQQMSSWFSS